MYFIRKYKKANFRLKIVVARIYAECADLLETPVALRLVAPSTYFKFIRIFMLTTMPSMVHLTCIIN